MVTSVVASVRVYISFIVVARGEVVLSLLIFDLGVLARELHDRPNLGGVHEVDILNFDSVNEERSGFVRVSKFTQAIGRGGL